MPQFTKTSQWKRFDNFKKGLEFSREIYEEAMQDYGLNKDQAFAFLYEEIDSELFSSDVVERFKAYTALFFCAYEHGIKMNPNDTFDEITLDGLAQSYKLLHNDCKQLPSDMQNEESQKIVQIVKDSYLKNHMK